MLIADHFYIVYSSCIMYFDKNLTIVHIKLLLLCVQIYICAGFLKDRDGFFKCLNSQNTTLMSDQICDGKFDCKDLSDEFLCPDKRLKYDSRLQYALESLHSGEDMLRRDSAVEFVHRMCIPHCTVRSHLKACEYCDPGQFPCSPLDSVHLSQICVTKPQVCDGILDCPNGEDENFCGQGMKSNKQLQRHTSEATTGTTSSANSTEITRNVTASEDDDSVKEDIKFLANTKIRCDVLDSLTPPFRKQGGVRKFKRRSKWKKQNPDAIIAEILFGNTPNVSILLNWVSHSRRGEPAPLQKYASRFLRGNRHNFSDIFLFNQGKEIPDGIEAVKFDELCDGVIGCGSFSDEILCPGKFYCENGDPLYIDKLRIMDGEADCTDGSDEWPLTKGHHTIASRYNLIGNWTLQVLVWVMAITALVGNIVVIWSTSVELIRNNRVATASAIMQKRKTSFKESITGSLVRTISGVVTAGFSGGSSRFRFNVGIAGQRRLVKTWNGVLVLNLATADLLMGIYLMWLAVMSAVYAGQNDIKEQYWTFEREWRTSSTCNMLGTILLVSSQTSVYTMVALTSLRLYTVIKPFNSYHLKFRYLFVICFLTWFCSICLAVVPVLPIAEEYFITHAWVPFPQFHPPNINKTVADNLARGIAYLTNTTIAGETHDHQGNLTWKEIVDFMKVVAPDHSNWKFYGYYSEDGVCMPKMFVDPEVDKFWKHTAAIVSLNLISVFYIAMAYCLIYYKSAIGQTSVGNQKTIACDNNENKLPKLPSKPGSKRMHIKTWDKKEVITHREEKPRLKVGDSLRKKYRDSKRRLHKRGSAASLRPSRNSSVEMQRRIALLIATDCACWIPICIMGFISMAGGTIPDTAYAITAIGLLPINSALNPILYSRFMRTLWARGWSSLRSRASTSFLSSSVISERSSSIQTTKKDFNSCDDIETKNDKKEPNSDIGKASTSE